MPHGPRLSTNVPPPLLVGTQLRGPKITKRYLKSSRLPPKTRPPYTFQTTLSPGLSALIPPTMLLVLFSSNSTPISLAISSIKLLPLLQRNTLALPSTGTPTDKRLMLSTSLSFYFCYYLRGKEFVLETDHRNLIWIESSQVPIIVRWCVLLQSYEIGRAHV